MPVFRLVKPNSLASFVCEVIAGCRLLASVVWFVFSEGRVLLSIGGGKENGSGVVESDRDILGDFRGGSVLVCGFSGLLGGVLNGDI